MIPFKLYAYAGVVVALVAAFLWYRHSLIAEGERKAYAAQAQAAHDQAVKDAKTSEETVNGLKSEMDHLRQLAVMPIPVVRLCPASRSVRAAPTSTGTPDRSAPTGDVPVVSDGAGAGPDVGAALRLIAEAADVVSARDRACLAWARGVTK
jgi:hypothetical protein